MCMSFPSGDQVSTSAQASELNKGSFCWTPIISISGLLGPEACLTCCRRGVSFNFKLDCIVSDRAATNIEKKLKHAPQKGVMLANGHGLDINCVTLKTFVSFPSESLQSSPVFAGNPRGHPPTPMILDQEDCHHPHLLPGICYLNKLGSTAAR